MGIQWGIPINWSFLIGNLMMRLIKNQLLEKSLIKFSSKIGDSIARYNRIDQTIAHHFPKW